jgi:hypothetical protein
LIIPYRNPIITAKMLVTLDVLSGGRVILGAGVGWMPEEFAAMGASYEHRGGVTDEYIQIFRELCTADKPSFEGKHYQFLIGFSHPKPTKNHNVSPGVDWWLYPGSLAPCRHLGDGWHPVTCRPRPLAESHHPAAALCRGWPVVPLTLTFRHG